MIGIQPKTTASDNQIRTLHSEGLNDVAIARRLGYSQSYVQRRRSGLGLAQIRRKPDARSQIVLTSSKKTSKQPVRQTHRPTAVPEPVEGEAVEELRHWRLGLLHAAAQRGMKKAQTEGWKSPWKIAPHNGERSVNRDEQMRALWKQLPANQQK